MKYALLLLPHPNARYTESLKSQCLIELSVTCPEIAQIEQCAIADMNFLVFDADLNDRQLAAIKLISGCMGLFTRTGDDSALRPVALNKRAYIGSDMAALLKYTGKTNPTFTESLLQLAVFSGDYRNDFDKPLNILDPMCGRGTTLFSALARAYNAYGVEIDKKDIHELTTFVKKYFEFHHYKHSCDAQSMTVDGKNGGMKYTFAFSPSAEAYKAGDTRTLKAVLGNTLFSDFYFKNIGFHAIVCDLPYGVQHQAQAPLKSIASLLADALPHWIRLLLPGGTIALSFNSYTLKRSILADILQNAGLTVFNDGVYTQTEHWVEQAVMRDTVIAKK